MRNYLLAHVAMIATGKASQNYFISETKHDQTATAATLPQTNEMNMSWVAGLSALLLAGLAVIAWRMRRN